MPTNRPKHVRCPQTFGNSQLMHFSYKSNHLKTNVQIKLEHKAPWRSFWGGGGTMHRTTEWQTDSQIGASELVSRSKPSWNTWYTIYFELDFQLDLYPQVRVLHGEGVEVPSHGNLRCSSWQEAGCYARRLTQVCRRFFRCFFSLLSKVARWQEKQAGHRFTAM